MLNHYLYIKEDGSWNWSDNVFIGIATLTPDRVSKYCLEQADKTRHSNLGNYDDLTKEQREKLAKLWEAAKDLPEGKYDYYFNLEDKREVFVQSVKELATRLGIKYGLTLKED